MDQIKQLCLSAVSCSKGACTGYMREQWPSRYELGGEHAVFTSQIVHLIQAQALCTGQQCKTRFGSLGVLRLSRGALSRKVVTSTTTSNASVGAPTGAGDSVGSPVGTSVRSGSHGSDNHRPSGGEPPGGGGSGDPGGRGPAQGPPDEWVGLWFKAYTRLGARRFRVFVRPGTSLRQAAGSVLPLYITAHGFYVRLANFLSPLNQHLGRLEPRSLLGPPHEGWIVGVGADAEYEDDMLLEDWRAESDMALAQGGEQPRAHRARPRAPRTLSRQYPPQELATPQGELARGAVSNQSPRGGGFKGDTKRYRPCRPSTRTGWGCGSRFSPG